MTAIDYAPMPYGILLRRFVIACAPAVVALLVIVPGIFIGYVPAMFVTVHPIGIGTTRGSSADLTLSEHGSPMIHVSDGHLSDLCLVPRVSVLPFVPTLLSLRIVSRSPVSLGQISFAGSATTAAGISMPAATVGDVSTGVHDDKDALGFQLRSSGKGRIRFHHLAADAYTLNLDHGLSLTSLSSIGISLGHLDCTPATGSTTETAASK